MTDVDTLYPMQSAPVTHLTGDIVEELYAETTSLREKLRDNIAGSREDMMSALDRLRQKCKRMHQTCTVSQDTSSRPPFRNDRLPPPGLPLLGRPHRQDPQLSRVLGRRQGQ
uniref:Uncharacterized protein n=1 Tax=Oryza glumipatula TaxID=40148 RepID=A0A0E0BSG3_9ORYZ